MSPVVVLAMIVAIGVVAPAPALGEPAAPTEPAGGDDPACGPVVEGAHVVSTTDHLRAVGSGGTGQGDCALGASYRQAANVDLGDAEFSPIGTGTLTGAELPFTGTYDGDGYAISNLRVNGGNAHSQGLFGAISGTAHISSIVLTTASVSGGYSVGLLVGDNWGGTIEGSSASGTVSGSQHNVGLLVGRNQVGSVVQRSAANGSASGTAAVGGLVGFNAGGAVRESYAEAVVTGLPGPNIGGLVGANAASGEIRDCYTRGVVTGQTSVGGLVGENGGQVARSYSLAQTSGEAAVGGLVGTNTGHGTVAAGYWDRRVNTSTVGVGTEDLSATLDVTGLRTISMLGANAVRSMAGLFSEPYDVWKFVEEPADGHSPPSYDYPRLINLDGTWQSTEGVDVLPIWSWEDLHLVRDHLHAWYSLNASLDEGSDGYVEFASAAADIGAGWLPIGSFVSPFEGRLEGHGNAISQLIIAREWASHQGLFGAIGQGGTVRNLTLENVDVVGGWVVGGLAGSSGGTIEDVSVQGRFANTSTPYPDSTQGDAGGLVGINTGSILSATADVEVVGFLNNIGGLVGQNQGTVESATVSGDVSSDTGDKTSGGFGAVGGLVGWNPSGTITASHASAEVKGIDLHAGGLVGDNSGTIRHSSADGPVSGQIRVGGLVGVNTGTVADSYALGDITGTGSQIGGLIGSSSGTVTNSYSRGLVSATVLSNDVGGLVGYRYGAGTVTDSFWDTETSGQPSSAGGEGRTTAKMTRLLTYQGWPIVAGWQEAAYGRLWGMCRQENAGYPFLLWQLKAATNGCLTPFAANSSVAADPPSVVADGTSTSTIVVEVRDDGASPGVPIPHVDVVLAHATDHLRIGGEQVTSATATTDAEGVASFTVSTATGGVVSFTALAVPQDVAVFLENVEVEFLETPAPTASAVSASAATVLADGADQALLSVTVRGFYDQPIADVEVVLDQGDGRSRIGDNLEGASATSTTDAQGLASFTVMSINAATVSYAATTAGVPLDATVEVTFVAVPRAESSTVSATEATVRADGVASSTIMAAVRDHADAPISNLEVVLSKPTSAVAKIDGEMASATSTTDAQGVASFTVVSEQIGSVPFTALADGGVPLASVTVSFLLPPSFPTSLTAVPADGRVTLNWQPPDSDGGSALTAYEFATATSSTPPDANAYAGLSPLATATEVTGLDNGTTTWFFLRARTAFDVGSAAVVSATPSTVPEAVVSLQATPEDGQVALHWSPPRWDGGSALTGYEVASSTSTTLPTDPAAWTEIGAPTAIPTTVVTDLTNGVSVWLFARARNDNGPGPASSVAATPRTVPGVPTALAATAGNAEVALRWQAPTDTGGAPILDSTVTASPGGGTCTVDAPATSCTVINLTNGTVYTFTVAARSIAGTGNPSVASNTVRPQAPPSSPPPPAEEPSPEPDPAPDFVLAPEPDLVLAPEPDLVPAPEPDLVLAPEPDLVPGDEPQSPAPSPPAPPSPGDPAPLPSPPSAPGQPAVGTIDGEPAAIDSTPTGNGGISVHGDGFVLSFGPDAPHEGAGAGSSSPLELAVVRGEPARLGLAGFSPGSTVRLTVGGLGIVIGAFIVGEDSNLDVVIGAVASGLTACPQPLVLDGTLADGRSVVLSFVIWVEAEQPPFGDVASHDVHRRAIDCLADLGVARGTTPGRYAPTRGLSRGQAATLLARLFHLDVEGTSTLPDVAGTTHEGAIAALLDAGVANGLGNGQFEPDVEVTRAQFASLLAGLLGLPTDGIEPGFPDAGETHGGAIGALSAVGAVAGYSDGTFRPAESITRAQAASLLVRALPLLDRVEADADG